MEISYSVFTQKLAEKGVTAYCLSKETGIPQSTFSDWKKGKSKPKVEKLLKIADFLECDIRDFIV